MEVKLRYTSTDRVIEFCRFLHLGHFLTFFLCVFYKSILQICTWNLNLYT